MTSVLEIALLLLATVVVGVVAFRLLHLPPLLAYLTVGILIGPHALALVPNSEDTRYLAEFGVVFLMFSIGLEFSLARLKAMRRIVLGLGGSQVVLTVVSALIAGVAIGRYFHVSLIGAFALGGALAMSSTAIVMKMLTERMQVDTEHGKRIVGVLLFQDIAVVPLLVIVPALGAEAGVLAQTARDCVTEGGGVVDSAAGGRATGGAMVVSHRCPAQVAGTLTLNLLLVTLARVADRSGRSFTGSGCIHRRNADFRNRIQTSRREDIKPFRDVLLGLFFVTIGMLLNVQVVINNFGWVMLALTAPVAFKFTLIFLLARGFGATAGTAIRTALALATAGEFGFVLLGQAGGLGLIDELVLQVVLAAMLLSMMAAPLMLQYSDRLVMRVVASEWLLKSLEIANIAKRAIAVDKHVVICGFGRSGQHLAKMLEQEDIAFVALDLDPDLVREAGAAGGSVVYGDAGRREALVAAGIARASALVITYADTHSALKVLNHVHELKPTLSVIVRTQDDHDLERLTRAGATEVVPEMLEGSLMLGSHALVLLGVPLSRVVKRVREARDQRYRLLRGHFRSVGDEDDETDDEQHQRLHSVPIEANAAAVGTALRDLDLGSIGAEVTSVRRRGIRGADPSPDMKLLVGDVVVLRGPPEALELAEQRLLQK